MNFNKIIIAISLGIALYCMTSCTLSKDELKRIVRKEAGKDDFRDSEKWGKVITKTLDLSEFTHIDLTGNADIKFMQGDAMSVEAYGNEKAIEGNDIYVEDGTLVVKMKEHADGRQPSIKLIVTAPTLESINVTGAGDIEMKDTIEFADDFDINVAGAGDVEIDRLKCKNFSIHISGAGDMKADMKANDISVAISGAGDADLDVKCQNLTVTAGGTGEIELKGECSHLTKNSSGLASIDSRKLSIHENIVIQ